MKLKILKNMQGRISLKIVCGKMNLYLQVSIKQNMLKEKKSYLVCTDNAKQTIEEAGLIGIGFEEVPVV